MGRVILPDRDKTKWLNFLVHPAGIQTSGRRYFAVAVTYLLPTARQVRARPQRFPVASVRRSRRENVQRGNRQPDPEVMAAETISIACFLPGSSRSAKPCKCTFPAMPSIKSHHIESHPEAPGTRQAGFQLLAMRRRRGSNFKAKNARGEGREEKLDRSSDRRSRVRQMNRAIYRRNVSEGEGTR